MSQLFNKRSKSILLWLLIFCSFTLSAQFESETLAICSFNIRYGTARDGLNSWKHRKEFLVDVIKDINPDVIGMQEALISQLRYIDNQLPKYSRFGIGRDGGNKGEFAPVYYNIERVELLDSGTFWFSDTPNKTSKDWGAGCKRISTWGHFRDKRTLKEFMLFNNHWDHKSELSRDNSAELLKKKASVFSLPTVMIGDFNTHADSVAIKILAGKSKSKSDPDTDAGYVDVVYKLANPQLFKDMADQPQNGLSVSSNEKQGTFHGFTGVARGNRIDLILVSSGIIPLSYDILKINREKRYPSDHFPVLSEILIK